MARANIRILVVDDNTEDLDNISSHFENEGVSVFKTNSAGKAFEIFKSERPHLIITEFALKQSTGLELVRKVRNIRKERKVPVIMYSYQRNSFDRDWALNQGVDTYLVKPVKNNDLVKIAKHLIRAYKYG